MRLIEEENELGLVRIAHFRQLVEQFGQEPQQKRRVQARVLHQLVGCQDVDPAASLPIDVHEVVELQGRQAEELGAALVLQHKELALDDADRRFGDVAIGSSQFGAVLGQKGEERA